ncbi:hypothetical protein ABPG74_017024 [Tetrahymena malaccensis]
MILRIFVLSQFILTIGKALLCDPKCTYCDSTNNCFQCQQGYKLNTISGICESGCAEGSYFDEPSQSCLSDCPQGFDIDINRKVCRTINYCDQITYVNGINNFSYNTNSQIYKNILIISGKQNLTVNENYLNIYQINDDYGFHADGTLNGHETSIISYTLLKEDSLNNILVSISSNSIIAWDMEQGIMKANINLNNNLYIDPNYYYLDQNILVLNYLNMNQFAIFNHKKWISSLINSTNSNYESEFFILYQQVHPSPIIGYKIQQNNYLISFDQNNMIVKWDIEKAQLYKVYQYFNYTISQVFTIPNINNQISDFFVISFEENTQINIIMNNNDTQMNYFITNHSSPITNILYDKNIQPSQPNIVQLISISQTEIIIFSFNMIQMVFNQVISYQQQVFLAKILNDQVIIAISNGLNVIQISQVGSNPIIFQLKNILEQQLQTSDYISDIQILQNQQNITYILVGIQLNQYKVNNQLSQFGNSTITSKLQKQQKYYKKHYGKVNGVVMDTSQNIYVTYSSDGSFGVWDTIQNNNLNLKPLFFQLPPWCNSIQTCQNSLLKALVIQNGVLLSYYDNNIFITWNISRYNTTLRNTYQLPSSWLSITNYGFFNNYFFLSNNKELQIFNFNVSETQIINTKYQQYQLNVSQVQIGFFNNTFYLIETFMNSSNPQQALLSTKFLSNFTQSQIITIKQMCLELEYYQLTQKIIVNYFSLYLTIASLPNLNSTTITAYDTQIVTQIYSPIQNQFIIITKSTYMWQYLPSGNGYTYNLPIFTPVPRRNFGFIQKSQFIVTQAGFSYFQNTDFNQIDNQVFNLIYTNLRVCSVFPFKEGIASISIVNNQLIFVGFVNGNLKVAQYVCGTFAYSTDKCNTQNTIFNPYLKKAYLFNYSKVIVVDLYSKTDTQLAYGHPTTNSVTVIQDNINSNMITYSRENTQNLYKFNQKTQVATQFLNGHISSVDFVFLDTQNDVLISHSTALTDLKVIVWSYSYAIQIKVFLDIQIFNNQTSIISVVRAAFDQSRSQVLILTYQGTLFTFNYLNYQVSKQSLVPKGLEFFLDPIYLKFYVLYNLYYIQIRNYQTLQLENEIIVSSILQNQKIVPSNKWITIISNNLLTIIDRYKQVYQSTILCNQNCGDFKISDKLNLCFSYWRGNSDSIDVFDNVSGQYLYTINGQQDIDIGAIKQIAIDDVNYLLFIGKLTYYTTVFFNYLTRQEVGYTFDSIFLFFGTIMNNQFNALSVADTSNYYIRSIEEQITSTFKFQDSYIVKTIDYYTSQNGDIYYIDGYQIVRKYRIQDKMVIIICQLPVYRQIAYYNKYLYILTYTQLLKYTDDFQPLASNFTMNIYGNQILGSYNNQLFVSTFNNTIIQIDQNQFTIINTITLDSQLIQYLFVQQFSDILLVTQSGTFVRYNYANMTIFFQVNAGYYFCYYNINFQIIVLASTLNQDLEFYPYNSILLNFTQFQLTNVSYPNNKTLSKIFIDEQYSNMYAVQANDRIIDIYTFQRSILNPSMNVTKVNFIPYINTIYSVKLDIVNQYIKVQIPWSISYYDRQNFNFYWQVQDPQFIQSIKQFKVIDKFPELIFMAQNTFLAVAYQNITNQTFNLVVKIDLDYPTILNFTVSKNFDQYMIQILLLVSNDIVNYSFNIPIVNGIPQQSYFQNCLIQIQDPKANYQVENILQNQQSYFSQLQYQSQGIQLKIFGSSFLYYNSLMQALDAKVQYIGNSDNKNLIISNNFFSENQNKQLNIQNQNLILTSSPLKIELNPQTLVLQLSNANFIQQDQSSFQIQNLTIQNLQVNNLTYLKPSQRILQAAAQQFQQSLFQFFKIPLLQINQVNFQKITGKGQQSIFDFRQNENILISNCQFQDSSNITIMSYTNLFQDQISTIIENNDLLQISNIIIQNYFHKSQSSIQFQGTSLQITSSKLQQIQCKQCAGSFLQFINSQYLQIINSTFIQNVGYNGGSIAIIQSQNSSNTIKDSSFKNNIAQNSGGAIYMKDSYLKLQNTTFYQNQALIGGAIRYLNMKPQEFNTLYFQQNNVTFVKNAASIHSQNWGSYIQYVKAQVIQKQNNRVIHQIQKDRQLQDIFQVNNLQSGGFISIQFQIFDEENNIVYYDIENCNNNQYTQDTCIELSQIKLTLFSQDDSKVRVVGSYTAYYNEFIKLTQGFQIIGIQLIGNPLSNQYIFLQADGLFSFQSVSSNSFLLPLNQLVYQDKYSLNFRQCEVGEILRIINSIYQCVQCEVGTYSLQNPTISNINFLHIQGQMTILYKDEELTCTNCPQQANYCYRNQMTLNSGYWKSANLSDNIYQCQTKENCNGNQEKGYCKEGHFGPLCQYCDEDGLIWGNTFQYDNQNGCVNCTQRSISTAIGQTLLISIILISYCIFNIISSHRASEKVIQAYYLRLMKLQCIARSSQNNEANMAIKALTSYLQLFKIISIYTLNLPQIIQIIPDLFGSPSSSTVITNACEIALLSTESMPHLYLKSLTMIISPILYILVLLIIYALLIHKKNNFSIRRSHLISSFVFLFQFVQPNIVQTLIAQISCKEFDGKKYIADDYTYECYSSQHLKFIMFLIGPGLAFYSLIYPSIILAIIYKSRKQLNNARIRLRYGYIYQDYNSKGFYWEYAKYSLKITIILIQNFYNFSQPKTKYLIIFLTISIYYMVLIYVQPYQMKRYQQVDQNSTIFLMAVSILNYFLNSSISDFQIYILYFILLLCQYFNGAYLISLILKVYLDRYLQAILNKVPNQLKNSVYYKYFLKKADIHSEKTTQRAIQLWMIVYRKSKFYRFQSPSLIKSSYQDSSFKNLYSKSDQNSPTYLKENIQTKQSNQTSNHQLNSLFSEVDEINIANRYVSNHNFYKRYTIQSQEDRIIENSDPELSSIDKSQEQNQQEKKDQKLDETDQGQEEVDIFSFTQIVIPNIDCNSNSKNNTKNED